MEKKMHSEIHTLFVRRFRTAMSCKGLTNCPHPCEVFLVASAERLLHDRGKRNKHGSCRLFGLLLIPAMVRPPIFAGRQKGPACCSTTATAGV